MSAFFEDNWGGGTYQWVSIAGVGEPSDCGIRELGVFLARDGRLWGGGVCRSVANVRNLIAKRGMTHWKYVDSPPKPPKP